MSASIRVPLLFDYRLTAPIAGMVGQGISLHGLEFEVPLDIGKRGDNERCDASGHDCLDQLHACPSFRVSLAANTESSISWLLWIRWMMSTRRATAGSTAASTVAVRPSPSSTHPGSHPTTRA